jgi:predicted O-methyltransferase YrrM
MTERYVEEDPAVMGAHGDNLSQFHNLLGVRSLTSRVDILRRQYLNHRFDARSPLPLLPAAVLDAIYNHEVWFPPRRLLMQPGAQTIDGIFFLASLGRALKVRSVFEIGTFIGLTAWTLARNLPDAVITTLDIPSTAEPRLALEKDDLHRASEDRLIYKTLPESTRIKQLWGDSAEFDFSRWFGEIDLAYVDGAHSEEYVASDTENALKTMSPDGAIVWDDYWRHSPGVVKVLHRRTDLDLYRVPGTRLVVHFSERARAKLPEF